MRKTIKIICIVLLIEVLVGLGLYYIPWSTHVDQKMYAAVLSEDGKVLYEVDIRLSEAKKDYLFQKDTTKRTIEFITEQTNKNRIYKDWRLVGLRDDGGLFPQIIGSYMTYNAAINSLVDGYFTLSFEKDALVLLDFGPEGEYLVASTDPDFDPLEILETSKEQVGMLYDD